MELSRQVTSLEISKRLLELGIKQQSLFYWRIWKDKSTSIVYTKGKIIDKEYISAYTASELGELLPKTIIHDGDECELVCIYGKKGGCYVMYCEDEFTAIDFQAETECDARGKMLIHLLESGLLKLEG